MPKTSEKQVLVFAGGGLGHVSGGVGTLLRYLIAEWAPDPAALRVRVIDTRGAGGWGDAALRFGHALAALAWGGLTGQAACAHINMTTRGSAWRKAILLVMARALGVPSVLHLHGADFFESCARQPVFVRAMLRAAVASAAFVVVIGQQTKQRLVEELGVSPGRVRVVMNGVPAIRGADVPRPRQHDDPVRLLFLGRIGARKGVPELVRALAATSMVARAWRTKIAGDGDGAPLAASLAAAGLSGRVDTPGWLDATRAARALAGADVLVLPSHHEVMPMAILEAMAHGLAIVATPVGCIPEILRDGENARLVPPGDHLALAAALAGLIDDAALRARLGEQARRDFAARLDIRIAAAELQAIYRAASTPPAPAPQARVASA